MPWNPIYILFLIFYTPCCLLIELNNLQQPHQEYTEELGLSATHEASLLPEFSWHEVHINFPSLIEEAGLIWLLYFLLQQKTCNRISLSLRSILCLHPSHAPPQIPIINIKCYSFVLLTQIALSRGRLKSFHWGFLLSFTTLLLWSVLCVSLTSS